MKQLLTAAGESLPEIPWEVYPRPQMKREDWLCLNGNWAFTAEGRSGTVRVPFCPESLLSGASVVPKPGERMTYERTVEIPEGWRGRRILLHFGAVSREARVFWNGREVARSAYNYLPFSAEVTSCLREGPNEIRVEVTNDLSPRYPWGKQKEKRGGMWYTPVSGIWQTVWLEPVPDRFVEGLQIDADGRSARILLKGRDLPEDARILCEGRTYPVTDGRAEIAPEDPRLWSPEHPELYSFTVVCGQDRIDSYFALRSLSVEEKDGIPRLCLNERPYFFHGLLDQGYWSDGLYTPADAVSYDEDILALKALGFNTLRKHIKIEPEVFYYACDRLGMAVFQDMVNAGTYSFFHDTLLPTVGLTGLSDLRAHGDPETREHFLAVMDATVQLLRNHPCVCYWTVFNEGWGQFRADEAYRRLKDADTGRFIDATSGWFRQHDSDVESLHVYFRRLRLGKDRSRPQVISEFGGYAHAVDGHCFDPGKPYGYSIYADREAWVEAVRKLYLEQVLPLIPEGLCACIYTQVSDVEDEINGLFTFDRRVKKLLPEEFSDVSDRLFRTLSVEE